MKLFGLNKKTTDTVVETKKTAEENRLRLLNDDTRFDIRESYKELRTNIMFFFAKKGCKVIAVTSSIASEGKSTTCFNTAITFAETGAKVLVIDCDMRRPNVAKLLNVKGDKGLSNILVGESTVDQVLIHSEYSGLDVITAGNIPPNPTELLTSDNVSATIEALKEKYDYIFLDTPPVTIVTDAILLSKVCDGFIVVVRQTRAEKKMLTDAVSKLRFVDAKIIGFVFNGVVVSKSGYGYYKKNYKYSKYSTYY